MTFEDLQNRFDYFEWVYDLDSERWAVQAVNLYGKWGHVTFFKTVAVCDPNYVEERLFALEDFRTKGQSFTVLVKGGRYEVNK